MIKLSPLTTGPAGLCAVAALAALTGCAVSREIPATVRGNALHGVVHGGQQPVTGATIQLYAAGNTGNASAATALLSAPVLTDATGGFDISGAYSCPSATAQVYLTATGGNPGLGAGANNGALALVAALGDCGNVPNMQAVALNELTTVSAAWALAPFASGVDHVGASATNLTGLQHAMQVAMMMADSNSGVAPSPNMPTNAQMETAKLITLADIIADCVNSDGTTVCSGQFGDATPSGGAVPADTFQTALTVAQNPANNVAALFNDSPGHVAFGGALTQAPHDWTMSIAYRGGGLQNPGDVTVDAVGNVWVADRSGALSGYLPSGSPMWANGLTGLGLSGTVSVSVDPVGNVWAANSTNGSTGNTSGSVTVVRPDGQAVSSQNGYVAGVDVPVTVALALDGRAWVANSGQSNVEVLNGDGTLASPTAGYGVGVLNLPAAIATTGGSDAWIVNKGSGDLTLINAQGVTLKNIHCSVAPDGLALDGTGNVWVADSSNGTLILVASNGVFGSAVSGDLSVPRTPAVDGGGNLFVINAGTSSIAMMPRSTISNSGTLLRPLVSLGQDAALLNPTASVLDASGNLWVTSARDSKLVRFVGVASPVKTPIMGVPVAP